MESSHRGDFLTAAAMTWREYHEATKHTAQSLRRTRHVLEWENMPDPFRHYEGVPLLDLPADPPPPEIPALELLQGARGKMPSADGPAFLSQLLYYSAAISASKLVPSTGYRYALRVNPSSGNLHPTEFHFLTRGLENWPDGLYHYRPSSHMAEQRAVGDLDLPLTGSAPLVLILTSIAWREAWKYRDRAYRYCLHDIGHAWQALTLAARALGCESTATGAFRDDELARSCRLNPDEWPMLAVAISNIKTQQHECGSAVWYGGQANQLSADPVAYPLIEAIHAATSTADLLVRSWPPGRQADDGIGCGPVGPPYTPRPFGEVARQRRSALDFRGGAESITLLQLTSMLSGATTSFIQLYLYVHRVEGLDPGVYRYYPQQAQLEQIKSGDQRVAAAALSLQQELAGNACVAFSMIADIERAVRLHGDRGYRYVHFEAGAIGQRMYLAAEALGLGATGIGAFFDDEVHAYLNLSPSQGQVVYHFAIGYPVPDPRVNAE